MNRKIPDVISDLNIFIAGKSYLGICESFKIPDLVQVMIEQNGALKGKVGSSVYESLECTFKIKELNLDLFTQFALNNTKKHIPLALRESIHKQGTGDLKLSIELAGEIESYTLNEDSVANTRELSVKMYCDFFDLRQDAKPLIIYDRLNSVLVVGGVDIMSELRKNLEL